MPSTANWRSSLRNMAMVELKGLHIVTVKGRKYAYAWRGGPRIQGEIGTPAFLAAYNEAIQAHRIPDNTRFRAVITLYRGSDAFQRLAPTTKRIWGRWLDRIEAHFGNLATKQFNRPEKIRPIIRRWRATMAHQPRTADYAMQVLSRVCSYAVDPLGSIDSNPCEGIKTLYTTDRSAIVWTGGDLEQLRQAASPEVMMAVDLAAETGLREADLFRLAWSHVQDDAIVIATSKSRFKREAVIPLHDGLRAVLARIPRRSTIVLTNSAGLPWRGFSSSFSTAMERAGLKTRDLHFHDLRGTAATRFYLAGLSTRVIAEIMGWAEDEVDKIIRRYVGRTAAVQDAIATIRARTGTERVKPGVKPPR